MPAALASNNTPWLLNNLPQQMALASKFFHPVMHCPVASPCIELEWERWMPAALASNFACRSLNKLPQQMALSKFQQRHHVRLCPKRLGLNQILGPLGDLWVELKGNWWMPAALASNNALWLLNKLPQKMALSKFGHYKKQMI